MWPRAAVPSVFVLSGDAAIDDYAEGIVLDEEHNLALLRYTLQTGNPRRLKNVLTEDAVYVSEASRQAWNGRDAIMDRLQYVRDANPDMECFAYLQPSRPLTVERNLCRMVQANGA